MGPPRYGREIEIAGPDDVKLVIGPAPHRYTAGLLSRSPLRPATDCQLCSIQNNGLRSLPEVRLEISNIRSFDDKKSAFREAVNLGVQWALLKKVGAGEWTEPAIFLRTDGNHLRLGDSSTTVLSWPNGDKSDIRRWRLSMKVVGLSEEWPIELDVRWTPATNALEMTPSVPQTDVIRRSLDAVAAEPDTQNEKTTKRSPQVPKRTPDLETSRRRIAFFDSIATELATVKQSLVGYCTQQSLKRKHPRFEIWKLLAVSEIKEIAEGAPFSPKSYAEYLTLSKFGITSRDTLKKDRRKLKRAGNC